MSWVPELREHVTETLNLDYMSSEEEVNNPSVRISKTRPFSSRFHLLPFISNLFYFVDNLKFVVFIFFHNPASYLYFLLWLAGAFSSLNCVLTVEQNVGYIIQSVNVIARRPNQQLFKSPFLVETLQAGNSNKLSACYLVCSK